MWVNKEAKSPANFLRLSNGFQLSQFSWSICSLRSGIIKLITCIWTHASGQRITQTLQGTQVSLLLCSFLSSQSWRFQTVTRFMTLPLHNFLTVHNDNKECVKLMFWKANTFLGKPSVEAETELRQVEGQRGEKQPSSIHVIQVKAQIACLLQKLEAAAPLESRFINAMLHKSQHEFVTSQRGKETMYGGITVHQCV